MQAELMNGGIDANINETIKIPVLPLFVGIVVVVGDKPNKLEHQIFDVEYKRRNFEYAQKYLDQMISDDAATNHNANEHVLKMMKFDTYKEDLRNKEEAMEDALLKLELSRHPASTNGGVHVFDLRTTPLP